MKKTLLVFTLVLGPVVTGLPVCAMEGSDIQTESAGEVLLQKPMQSIESSESGENSEETVKKL